MPYGLPRAVYIIPYPAHIVGYDGERKTARWCAYKIESKSLIGNYFELFFKHLIIK